MSVIDERFGLADRQVESFRYRMSYLTILGI